MSRDSVDAILKEETRRIDGLTKVLLESTKDYLPTNYWADENDNFDLEILNFNREAINSQLQTALTCIQYKLRERFASAASTRNENLRQRHIEAEKKSFESIWLEAIQFEVKNKNEEVISKLKERGILSEDKINVALLQHEIIKDLLNPNLYRLIQQKLREERQEIIGIFKHQEADFRHYINKEYEEAISGLETSFFSALHTSFMQKKNEQNLITRMIISRVARQFSENCSYFFEYEEIAEDVFKEVIKPSFTTNTRTLEKKFNIFRQLQYATWNMESCIHSKYLTMARNGELNDSHNDKIRILNEKMLSCLGLDVNLTLPTTIDFTVDTFTPSGPAGSSSTPQIMSEGPRFSVSEHQRRMLELTRSIGEPRGPPMARVGEGSQGLGEGPQVSEDDSMEFRSCLQPPKPNNHEMLSRIDSILSKYI